MNTSPSSSVPDHIHMDPIGGISGDMFVAAMLDATQCKKNEITEELNLNELLVIFL